MELISGQNVQLSGHELVIEVTYQQGGGNSVATLIHRHFY